MRLRYVTSYFYYALIRLQNHEILRMDFAYTICITIAVYKQYVSLDSATVHHSISIQADKLPENVNNLWEQYYKYTAKIYTQIKLRTIVTVEK